MTARTAAIVLALALNPATLHAQDLVFTVSASSADVHKGPSVATPVIGHVSGGTAMPVLRNLGSWVKVPWPSAPDGFAYLHVTTGRLAVSNGAKSIAKTPERSSSGADPASASPKSVAAASPAPAAAPATARTQTTPRPARERVVIRQQGSTAISHVVGLGGLIGSTDSFGATTRLWRDNGLGFQFAFTRDEMTSAVAPGRVTSMQLEPDVVYALFDRVGDYFWFRPYVGAGVSIRHQTLHDATPGAEPAGSTGAGFRAFGGSEVTFAGAPRFGLSVDAGYRRVPTPFPGFEADRFTVSLAGHWYLK